MSLAGTVDEYLEKSPWRSALMVLRSIMQSAKLQETIKWGIPIYTLGNKNIVGFAGFKDHFALWFHQGVFLTDPYNVLVNAQEGTTKGLRQWRFTSESEMEPKKIQEYVLEAIDNQKRGLEIKPERKEIMMPTELDDALSENAELKLAFDALTPGRRREYAEYIGQAKQEKTRYQRLDKCIPMIKSGIGLNDRYK